MNPFQTRLEYLKLIEFTNKLIDSQERLIQTVKNQKEIIKTQKEDLKNKIETEESLREAILEEVEHEREKYTCQLCLDAPKTVVFIPCNHFSTCRKCAEQLEECPFCRQWIEEIVVVFT